MGDEEKVMEGIHRQGHNNKDTEGEDREET